MDYEIVNIVVNADLSEEVDKEEIDNYFGDISKYNPDSFAAVTIRRSDDDPVILLYGDNLVATGIKDVDNPEEIIEWLSDELPEGIECENATVCNMVALNHLGKDLNLKAMMLKLGMNNCEYEPEQFPSLIYKPENENYFGLIFNNGKMMVNGVTNIEEMEESIETIERRLTEKASQT